MAVIPLVPETKMVDVGKLISLENLLVRKVTWLVLTSTSALLILSCAFGADHMTRIAYIYSRLPRTLSLSLSLSLSLFLSLSLSLSHTHTHVLTSRDSTLSHILTYRDSALSLSLSLSSFSTSINSLTLPVRKTQLNTRNMGAYAFCNLFLSCSAFSVRLVPASNRASEISWNPERDKQATWEKTRSS